MASQWEKFLNPKAQELLEGYLAVTPGFLSALVDKNLLKETEVDSITAAGNRANKVACLIQTLNRCNRGESVDKFCEALVEDESASQAFLAKKLDPKKWNDLGSRYEFKEANAKSSGKSREEIALQMERSAKFLCQAGEYDKALDLLSRAKVIEDEELGGRYERVASLLYNTAYVKSEILKTVDFIDASTCRQSKEIIDTVKEVIGIRRRLMGEENLKHLGLSLLLCCFNLSAYREGLARFPKENASFSSELSQATASIQGKDMAKESVEIFQKLGDNEHVAEAYMVWGLQFDSNDQQQLQYLSKGLAICLEWCGRFHPLTSRFKLNIGIFYEIGQDYKRAYEYFNEWNEINEEVFGTSHPKTARSRRTLQEKRYADMKNNT